MIIQKIRNIIFGLLFIIPCTIQAMEETDKKSQKELNKDLINALYLKDHEAACKAAYGALTDGADPDCREELTIDTALGLAIQRGSLELLDILLLKGANPNLVSSWDLQPLVLAIRACLSESLRLDLVHSLLFYRENPALVNARGSSGWTALHHAASIGAILIVKYLLSQEADVNLTNASGQTADQVTTNKEIKNLIESVRQNGLTSIF